MIVREESGAGWRMLLGDCIAVMDTMSPGSVDVTLTDPPYEAEAHTKARRALVDSTQKRGAVNTGKVRRIDQPLEIDFGAITDEDRSKAANRIATLTKRWSVAFCQIEAISAWRSAFTSSGLEWVRGGVWRKPDGAPQFTGDRPGQGFECLAIAHPPGRKRWNGGGRHAFWQFPLEHAHGGGGKAEHPTIKPLALMLALVDDFTKVDEIVLDPFAGSGTTGVACLRRGRQFIGIERNERYFDLAVERLRAETACTTVAASRAHQVSLFGGGSR